MYALVSGSQLIRTTSDSSFSWNNLSYSSVNLLSPAERIAAGIYDFVKAESPLVSGGQQLGGVSYVVDDVAGTVTETMSVVAIDQAVQPKWFTNLVDAQLNKVSQACTDAIVGGFKSSALGTVHHYPSNLLDQQNLSANVLSSLLPNLPVDWTTMQLCGSDALVAKDQVWMYRAHTVTQIQQVGSDGKASVMVNLALNASLANQLKALVPTGDSIADYAAVTAIVF